MVRPILMRILISILAGATLTMLALAQGQPVMTIRRATNNTVTIVITNLYTQSLVALETSTNLSSTNWIPISTNVALFGGASGFPNIPVTNSQIYFRARYVSY